MKKCRRRKAISRRYNAAAFRDAIVRRAVLLYNPESGRDRKRRTAQVEAAASELRAAEVEATAMPTEEPGSAGKQAREAVAAGYDTVIACGGDGTVHEVLQGIVGSEAALGVIPLGTGNALANDLGLPRDPAAAARQLLGFVPRPTAIGRIGFRQSDGSRGSRYFIVVAGVGADAHMVYRLALSFKQRAGMSAYYTEATRQWLTYSYPEFSVELRNESGQMRRVTATQVLAVRVDYFGGLLRRLAPGASLGRDDLRLVIFQTRSRLTYLRYMIGVLLGSTSPVPGVELVNSTEVRCSALPPSGAQIYAEADGELLGTLPIEVSIGGTVRLLTQRERSGH